MPRKELGQSQGRRGLLANPQFQSLDAPPYQVRIPWTHDVTDGILKEMQSLQNFRLTRHQNPSERIAVPPQIFGCGVHHDLGAELKGSR